MNVGKQTMSYLVNIDHITRENWSNNRTRTTNKRLLYKDKVWVMAKHIRLEGSELIKGSYSTGIPGDDVKRKPVTVHCVSGEHVNRTRKQQYTKRQGRVWVSSAHPHAEPEYQTSV